MRFVWQDSLHARKRHERNTGCAMTRAASPESPCASRRLAASGESSALAATGSLPFSAWRSFLTACSLAGSAAALDHSISSKEAKDIRECWDKLKSYAEGFVRCCEEGDYDQMMHIPKPSEGPDRYAVKK